MPILKEYSYQTSDRQLEYRHVVNGNFPTFENVKDLAVIKFNRLLGVFLAVSIFISMVSYSSVVAQEGKITDMHKNIIEKNYENIELQNQVDYLKSFYNIDRKVSGASSLQKPEKVLEVSDVNSAAVVNNVNQPELKIDSTIGY